MKIGTVSRLTTVPAKTIRYYESVGLIPRAERMNNGYRAYSENDVATLRFISRARSLGFSVKQVSGLLTLWYDQDRTSAQVKSLALEHIKDIENKITELQSLRTTLFDLTEKCHGDDRPDCPILNDLAKA